MGVVHPNVIEGKVGEIIKLNLINMDTQFHEGDGWHQFASEELDFDYKVPPSENMIIILTVGEAGEHEFFCDICCGGRDNPYMLGKIIVN